MISAFGVDHGYEEIEKGLSLGGAGAVMAGGTRKLAGAMSRGGAQMRRGTAFGGKMPGAQRAVGAGMGRAGGTLRSLGTKMAARPRMTAGVVGGVGALGAGGAGGAMLNRQKQF